MSEMIQEELEQEQTEQEEAKFVVDDDQKAEWCLEKIREHKAEIEKWTAHYEAEKRRACMDHENRIMRLESMLRGYFFERNDSGLTRHLKSQTAYNLPTGKLVLKKQEPEYEKNEEAIIAWLRANAPQFIKTKESVDWAGMKDEFGISGDGMWSVDEETGEMTRIPGVNVKPRDDIFKVEVK